MEKNVKTNRLIAAIIDNIFISLLTGIISGIIGGVYGFILAQKNPNMDIFETIFSATQSQLIIISSAILDVLAIFIWFTVIPILNKNRATVGKMLLGLKVIREDDSTPNFLVMLIRNIRLYFAVVLNILAILQLYFAVPTFLVIGISVMEIVLYIFIIININKSNTCITDTLGKTLVVDKLYNKDLKNFQTVEEIKDWADVDGFKTKTTEVEYVPQKSDDVTDKNYWN